MNDVRPFRGLRFDESVVGLLGSVVCPPYDVITPEEQLQLSEKSEHNTVRLEYGLQYPGDDAANNQYTRASATLDRWLAEGALRVEDEPALYIYEQQFVHEGKALARRGVLGALRLTPWEEGVVLPHEETMPKPKADRLQLMRATACNLSPLFLLFDDPTGTVERLMAEVCSAPPDATADTGDGQLHRLWVAKGAQGQQLAAALKSPQLYMADGHHRYETALAYRDERRAQDQPPPVPLPETGRGERSRLSRRGAGLGVGFLENAAYNYALVLLVEAHNPGLVVLPTHRLVRGLDQETLSALDSGLSKSFDGERVLSKGLDAAAVAAALVRAMAEGGQEAPTLGLYQGPGEAWILKLRGAVPNPAGSRPLLDVDVLHEGLMVPLLGIGPAQLEAGSHVSYTRDAAEAVAAVDRGDAQLALLLNPTKVEQVLETARAHGKMPQKSTYFYPKATTGLVFHRLS